MDSYHSLILTGTHGCRNVCGPCTGEWRVSQALTQPIFTHIVSGIAVSQNAAPVAPMAIRTRAPGFLETQGPEPTPGVI